MVGEAEGGRGPGSRGGNGGRGKAYPPAPGVTPGGAEAADAGRRKDFLSRIRAALGRSPRADTGRGAGGGQAPPRPDRSKPMPRRSDHPGDDRDQWPARFVAELEAVGGTGEIAPARELPSRAAGFAAKLPISRVVSWNPRSAPGDAGRWLDAILKELEDAGKTVLTWPAGVGEPEEACSSGEPLGARLMAEAARSELGIAVAEAAVPSSGTIMLISGVGKGRSVSLLPEHLLVIVPQDAFRESLADALTDIRARYGRKGEYPQNISFITGPSKSADIGQHLVTGVHGPRNVHAIVVGG